MEADHTFESAVHRHDAQVAELGLPIWVGSEPTFTDREAQTPAWLHAALGDDKELRARALLGTVCGLMPGGLVLRSTGRLYPGEKLPRWNSGPAAAARWRAPVERPAGPAAGRRTGSRRATGHRRLRQRPGGGIRQPALGIRMR
jgi:uncharacterized protein (DUF2126 family)